MSSLSKSRALLAGIAVAAALLAAPALSGASNASVSGGELRYLAAAGETNDLTISVVGANFILDDPGATIIPGAGCAAVNLNRVSCAAAAVDDGIRAELGNLNDELLLTDSVPELASSILLRGEAGNDTITSLSDGRIRAFGGIGNDTLIGGPGGDRLEGEDGDDTAAGNGGNDFFVSSPGTDSANGGPGSDDFEAGSVVDGPDNFIGGTGFDSVSYRGRLSPIVASLDGVGDDGELGEGDSIGTDVEEVDGGNGADTISGNEADNDLSGDEGNDTISGGGGDDRVNGSGGTDAVSGGPGNDRVEGDAGADSISGEQGDDVFSFEAFDGFADQISGGVGIDTYRDSSVSGLTIDLDGVADDGFRNPLEGPAIDNVGADLENIIVTESADDILTGNNSANQIEGGAGNDRINGLGGPDALLGDAGDDFLNGGPGIDSLDGAGGVDRLRTRDRSPDEASCGSASDILLADQLDDFSVACDRSSTGALLKSRTARLKKGRAKLTVSCPAAEGIDCKVKLTASKGRKTLATGAGKVKSGKTSKVTLKLTRAGRKARSKKLSLRTRTVLTDATGAKVTTTVPKLVLSR